MNSSTMTTPAQAATSSSAIGDAEPAGPFRSVSLPSEAAYDKIFWLTYLANGLTTVANAMLVRYADFVDVLGGEEWQL
jgi:hypothetical protein